MFEFGLFVAVINLDISWGGIFPPKSFRFPPKDFCQLSEKDIKFVSVAHLFPKNFSASGASPGPQSILCKIIINDNMNCSTPHHRSIFLLKESVSMLTFHYFIFNSYMAMIIDAVNFSIIRIATMSRVSRDNGFIPYPYPLTIAKPNELFLGHCPGFEILFCITNFTIIAYQEKHACSRTAYSIPIGPL